jgi:Fe-S-cluster-containing dehydrogenase component
MEEKDKKESRRNFLKMGLGIGVTSTLSVAGANLFSPDKLKAQGGEKVKVLTQDGQLVEVDKSEIVPVNESDVVGVEASKIGIPNRKFVMVIDLGRCKNARKCIEACQEGHQLPKDQEWIKVYLLQDSEQTAPYWFPRPCFHCDNPMCVSVCPVGATYKRTDGIVLVDTDRCIGCKFCMTGCPFSARQFNWKEPENADSDQKYSPETGIPGKEGTVGKCVFCPDKLREGKLPRCVTGCPMGAIYFGDLIEDAVTNGAQTVRFSDIIRDRSGYRKFEELGTEPNVYYLPPVERQFPIDRGLDGLEEEDLERYKDVPYIKKMKENESGV